MCVCIYIHIKNKLKLFSLTAVYPMGNGHYASSTPVLLKSVLLLFCHVVSLVYVKLLSVVLFFFSQKNFTIPMVGSWDGHFSPWNKYFRWANNGCPFCNLNMNWISFINVENNLQFLPKENFNTVSALQAFPCSFRTSSSSKTWSHRLRKLLSRRGKKTVWESWWCRLGFPVS